MIAVGAVRVRRQDDAEATAGVAGDGVQEVARRPAAPPIPLDAEDAAIGEMKPAMSIASPKACSLQRLVTPVRPRHSYAPR